VAGWIVAIDPGYTTGVVIGSGADFAARRVNLVRSYDVAWETRDTWFMRLFKQHSAKALVQPITHVVIESFTLTDEQDALQSQIGSEMPSSRVIGLVEGLARVYGLADRIYFQHPRDRYNMRILDGDRARLGRSRHCIDAYRHMRYFVATHRG